MNVKQIRNLILLGLAVIVGLPILLGTFKIVRPGERGVYVFLGKVTDTTLNEGLHFKLPIVSKIEILSVRVQRDDTKTEAATKDLQKITATVSLNWNLDQSKVAELFKNIGNIEDIHDKIISPAVSEVLKASTAKMTAEEVLTKRLELKDNIDALLIKRLTEYGITVKSISLIDLNFDAEFNKAVEAKQIAEQDSQKAVYNAQKATEDAKGLVNTAKGEAEATLTKARAQAESQKLLQSTVTPEILRLKAIEKWSGEMPQVLGGGNQMLFNIPVGTSKEDKK